MEPLLESHLRLVVKALQEGKLVPFLGAGVNVCGRPSGAAFHPGECLPTGRELAAYLADSAAYPQSHCTSCGGSVDLLRVAQFVVAMAGEGALYSDLHQLFDADYPLTTVHRLLASIPLRLRAKGLPARFPLIVTTNYDDLMERALAEAGEPFDIVSYVAEGEHRGLFLHWPPERERPPIVISTPNEYGDVSTAVRTVVMKIHGSVDRRRAAQPSDPVDSYVITEDDYIEYLARTDLAGFIPVHLLNQLRNSHFLFLGYGLADWNLRVILHRIAAGRAQRALKSWAVQLRPDLLERKFWERRDIDIVDMPLDDYAAALDQRLGTSPSQTPAPVRPEVRV